MARVIISTLIGDVDTIASNLKKRLGDEDRQVFAAIESELDAWLAEARDLERQQEIDTGQTRRTTERRQQIRRQGVELRGRAQAMLQGHFGKKAKALHDFGLQPRRDPRPAARSRRPSPEPTPQPTSPEQPAEADSAA
jgi:hypothetical protein